MAYLECCVLQNGTLYKSLCMQRHKFLCRGKFAFLPNFDEVNQKKVDVENFKQEYDSQSEDPLSQIQPIYIEDKAFMK